MSDPEEARLRVVIVEEDQEVSADLQHGLADLGYSVLAVAPTGQRVIDLAEKAKPDLVLIDLRKSEGAEGIVAAQEIGKSLRIPVVLVGFNSHQQAVSGNLPSSYLSRPFGIKDLNSAILTALSRHQK